MNTFIMLYDYLRGLGVATDYDDTKDGIICSCTSEAILYLLRGLNHNEYEIDYHAELIGNCTWLLTRS